MIQNEVEDTLSDELLSGRLNDGDVAIVDVEDDKIVIPLEGAGGGSRLGVTPAPDPPDGY